MRGRLISTSPHASKNSGLGTSVTRLISIEATIAQPGGSATRKLRRLVRGSIESDSPVTADPKILPTIGVAYEP